MTWAGGSEAAQPQISGGGCLRENGPSTEQTSLGPKGMAGPAQPHKQEPQRSGTVNGVNASLAACCIVGKETDTQEVRARP